MTLREPNDCWIFGLVATATAGAKTLNCRPLRFVSLPQSSALTTHTDLFDPAEHRFLVHWMISSQIFDSK